MRVPSATLESLHAPSGYLRQRATRRCTSLGGSTHHFSIGVYGKEHADGLLECPVSTGDVEVPCLPLVRLIATVEWGILKTWPFCHEHGTVESQDSSAVASLAIYHRTTQN